VRALVIMHGRWRRGFTFEELAAATGLTVAEVRSLLSVFRTLGNAVWERREREDSKFKKRGELSVKARELSKRGLTVREIAQKMGISIGFVSELRRAA
jgi:transcriptional regulator with XRE-family HTH domain